MIRMRNILSRILKSVACLALLSLVCATSSLLPNGETIGQWVWFDKAALVAAFCIGLSLLLDPRGEAADLGKMLSWALVLWGGVEAAWGLCQLYGFAASRHSLYPLTGSFFNPGPYSGYLAVAFPVCLHGWLAGGKVERKGWKRVEAAVAGASGLLIACALPAGMSRSAWLAAGISGLWVYGCNRRWNDKVRGYWHRHRWRVVMAVVGGCCVLVSAGVALFVLKPDSARGRLFMWRMAGHAIAGEPLTGHGTGGFAAAYGEAQEAYFAAGRYEVWEERVAGSPEYAFNEYVQVAVEHGLPVALALCAVVTICLCAGVRRGRYGIAGAVLALMIFSFSSYPMRLPAFVVTAAALLAACVWSGSGRQWLMLAAVAGGIGGLRLKADLRTERACRDWVNAKVLYSTGAGQAAVKDYERLYPLLKGRAAFLFEYGHGLHKLKQSEASNRILREALERSNDPMILNIIGKNYVYEGDYRAAEEWFVRSTHRLPGRVYPYYLLAKLYAEPAFARPEKFERMKRIVLTKEPKVHSTAIRQMREEVRKMGRP